MSLFSKEALAIWFKGLVAALIGGGSGGVTAGIAANLIAPQDFNLGGGLIPLLKLMGVCFVVKGLISAFTYLSQSPIPKDGNNAPSA